MSLLMVTFWLLLSTAASYTIKDSVGGTADLLSKDNGKGGLFQLLTPTLSADPKNSSHLVEGKHLMAAQAEPQTAYCGNRYELKNEISTPSLHHRAKRFTLYENLTDTWADPRTPFPLTVGYFNYLPTISRDIQDDIAIVCAAKWAEVSGLSFMFVRNKVPNIYISFEPIAGDPGAGGTVGEAGPPYPGDDPPLTYLSLDDRETWKPRYSSPGLGLSLEEVLCHEMGHNLGLGHSDDPDALMYLIIGGRQRDAQLGQDDIDGIQSLYGLPNGETIVDEDGQSLEPKVQVVTQMGSARRRNCNKLGGRRRRNCLQNNNKNREGSSRRNSSRRRKRLQTNRSNNSRRPQRRSY